jgi:flagellar L-ring protein FlgH
MRIVLALALLAALPGAGEKKPKGPEPSPLDRYILEASARGEAAVAPSPGSTWSPVSRFADLATDLRAAHVDDMVTVLVVERASAVARGSVKTSRQSEVRSGVGAIAGPVRPGAALADLARADTAVSLQGEGATTRETVLSTTLAARVTHVLPNGYLVVEGTKNLQVNAERQLVTVRGMVRPADIGPGNVVLSDRLAQLEVRINGRGVVGDAIRRPFFLYRLLLGLLPF